jgi:hypothetical protein
VPIVGACGTVVVVIELEFTDATEEPEALTATTMKVYATPDCNPVTEIGEVVPVPVYPPTLEVTR